MELENSDSQVIIRCGKIKKTNLKKDQYTSSLLSEALRVELISDQQFNGIQIEILNLLKDLIARYTKEESSSVTADTAENILKSVLYAIDMYVISFDNPEEAIEDIIASSIKEIYDQGVMLVSRCFDKTRALYNEVYKNRLDIKADAYNATLRDAIPAFLNKYGIIFESHHTMASIDYPLAITVDDKILRGILFIEKYLEHLNLETQFCNYFSKEDIQKILSEFGGMIKMESRIELINIFELVFNNSVFSTLAGGDGHRLVITKYDYAFLNEQLTRLNTSMITSLIDEAVQKLIVALNINHLKMLDYINQYKPIFTKRIINAVQNDTLSGIIVTEKAGGPKTGAFIFREGEWMSDADFKSIVNKLLRLSKTVQKIKLIKTGVTSLHDFIDILNSNCLFGKEFEKLYNFLSDIELAILTKIVFYEEFRSGFPGLATVISQKKAVEADWQEAFVEFIQKLGESRIKSIEGCLNEVDYEEISFY